jgi:hypothetical protein
MELIRALVLIHPRGRHPRGQTQKQKISLVSGEHLTPPKQRHVPPYAAKNIIFSLTLTALTPGRALLYNTTRAI